MARRPVRLGARWRTQGGRGRFKMRTEKEAETRSLMALQISVVTEFSMYNKPTRGGFQGGRQNDLMDIAILPAAV